MEPRPPGSASTSARSTSPTGWCASGDDRVVAGVAGGVGRYLGVDPTVVRLALVVLTFANGLGALLYLVGLGAACPTRTPTAPPAAGPSAHGRAGRRARAPHPRRGAAVRPRRAGPARRVVWAVALSAVGFGLVWARTDEEDRTRGLLWRAAGGGLLLVVGLGVLFASGGVLSTIGGSAWSCWPPASAWRCCSGPWIVRLWSDLGVERRERIRSEERSEIAAHLHDSVLQTLALIQRAEAPGRARTLARRQERELRAWLFDERPPDGEGGVTTLGAALEQRRHRRGGPPRRRGRPGAGGRLPRWSRGSRPSWPRCARPPTTPPATPAWPRCRVYVEVEPAAGHGLRPRPGQGVRPRRRSSRAGSACASRSSGGWPATAAGPRSTPRPARAPRSSSRWPHAP